MSSTETIQRLRALGLKLERRHREDRARREARDALLRRAVVALERIAGALSPPAEGVLAEHREHREHRDVHEDYEFHRLWSSAAGLPRYHAPEWRALGDKLLRAQMQKDGEGQRAVLDAAATIVRRQFKMAERPPAPPRGQKRLAKRRTA